MHCAFKLARFSFTLPKHELPINLGHKIFFSVLFVCLSQSNVCVFVTSL